MTAEKFKEVQIGGRVFRVCKFKAREGGFVILKLAGILAPLFDGMDLSAAQNLTDPSQFAESGFNVFGMVSKLSEISEEDYTYLQDKALKSCFEILSTNPRPVPILNDNGSFGVANLEDDTMLVLALTAHALFFNLTSFFTGSPLEGLLGGLLGSNPSA